jgi:hypothetical protein
MKKSILTLFIILFSIPTLAQSNHTFYSLKQEAINGIKSNNFPDNNVRLFETKSKKSAGIAILYSLLLPGMGELYAESYDSGIYFTIADGVLWSTLVGMNVYGNWQKDRYISYAKANAGITTNYKDGTYYATIADYSDINVYNDEKAFEGSFDEMYSTQIFYWKWNSKEQRRTYRSMWLSSEQTFNDVRFVVGALILNRVVSAINAVRLVSKYNNSLKEEVSWNLSVGLNSNLNLPTALTLNFQKNL